MKPADEIQWFANGSVAFWQAYDPSSKVNLSCTALRIGDTLLFIDPISLTNQAIDELTSIATPVAIILTNGNHERAAKAFAQRFNIPILAHAEAVPQFSFRPDSIL